MRTIKIWTTPHGIDIAFIMDEAITHVLVVDKLREEHVEVMNEWILGGDISDYFDEFE